MDINKIKSCPDELFSIKEEDVSWYLVSTKQYLNKCGKFGIKRCSVRPL